jgi:hypothetical protein
MKKLEKVIHGGNGRRWIKSDDKNSKGRGKESKRRKRTTIMTRLYLMFHSKRCRD